MVDSTGVRPEPKSPDTRQRLRIGIAAVLVLVVVAIAIQAILSSQQPKPLPEGSPARVVQQFSLAIENRDYPGAFQYLTPTIEASEGPRVRSYAGFRNQFGYGSSRQPRSVNVVLDSETVEGDTAHVVVYVSYPDSSGPPLLGSSAYGYNATFTLQRVSGEWRIVDYPYAIISW